MLRFSNEKTYLSYKAIILISPVIFAFIIYSYFAGYTSLKDAVLSFLIFGFLVGVSFLLYRYTSVNLKVLEDGIELCNPVTKTSRKILYSEIDEVELSDLTSKIYIKLIDKKTVSLGSYLSCIDGEFTVPLPGPAAVAGVEPRLKDEIESRVEKAKFTNT